MVVSCCAYGCTNRYNSSRRIGFYRFPSHPSERRERWIKALKRKDWTPSRYSRICGDHFVTGKPVDSPDHTDYVPSVFNFPNTNESDQQTKKEQRKSRQERQLERRHRAEKRDRDTREREAAEALSLLQGTESTSEATGVVCDASVQTDIKVAHASCQTSAVKIAEAVTQTEDERLTVYGCDILRENDKRVQFYTGLPSWKVFLLVLNLVAPHVPKARSSTKLKYEDELLLVLMKLRLNLMFEDLAVRFNIGQSTADDIFQKWIDVIFVRLKFLIAWPEKDIVQSNMPQIFKDTYPNTRCIIDCSEVFIERPYMYYARAQTYSNYKKHNTVKILLGISPNGVITFASKCWGGRVTDKEITQKSGFLDLLEPGDVVLADRGFNIKEDIEFHRAKLEIPAFIKRGRSQFSQKDVEYSARLAKIRIHVERVIGLLKNKYTILQATLPIRFIKHDNDTEYSQIDKIVIICCALANLSKPVVPY